MSESTRKKKRNIYPYKRDTGITRLPTGEPIREELYDGLKKIPPGGHKTSLPASPAMRFDKVAELKSTRELQEERWNGLRRNEISRQVEIWIQGNIMKRLPIDAVDANPGILANAFEEVFGLKGHFITTDKRY